MTVARGHSTSIRKKRRAAQRRKSQLLGLGLIVFGVLLVVSSFIQQSGFSFPVLLDQNNNVLTRLGINSFPTSFLVGPDGIVKAIHIGMFTRESLEAEITSRLNEK